MSKLITTARAALTATLIGAATLGLAGTAAAAPGTVYGDPQGAAQYWAQQTLDDCVLMATAGLDALEQYLGAGRKVIVIVDPSIIWNEQTDGSDHGVVVTGVDTGAGVVHLNDSGLDDGADEQVSIDAFQRAWQASDGTMIVTRN